jgi:hypothetical protein
MDSDEKHKLIIDEHFPTVITKMIMSYIGKFNLQFVESSNDDVVTMAKKLCIKYDFFKKMCNSPSKISPSLPYDTEDIHSSFDIVNENLILYNSLNRLVIFDVKTSQVIKDFYFSGPLGYYVACDGIHFVFRDKKRINILNIKKMKIISTIDVPYAITSEIGIYDDIIYITRSNAPLILKYRINGEYIDTICLSSERLWSKCHIKITCNGIVIGYFLNVIFYDFEGNKLGESRVRDDIRSPFHVTSNFICIVINGVLHKYKRIM